MTDKQLILIALGTFVALSIPLSYVVWQMDRNKKTAAKTGRKVDTVWGIVDISTVIRMHSAFMRNPLTRQRFLRINEALSALSVYTMKEIKTKSVTIYIINLCILPVMLILAIILFDDVFMILMLLLFGMVIQEATLERTFSKSKRKALKSIWEAASDLQQNYSRFRSVAQSLEELEVKGLAKNSFSELSNVISATDKQSKLEEFYNATPFRHLQNLAGVCVLIEENGDEETSDGRSVFMDGVDMVREELIEEYNYLNKQKSRFGLLGVLPVLPIFMVGTMENYLRGIMPGMSIFYDGFWGYVSRMSIIVSAIFGFWFIATVTKEITPQTNMKSPSINNLLKKKWFSRIVQDVTPKNAVKRTKKFNKIRRAMANFDLEYLYAYKIAASVVVFVFAIIFSMLTVQITKEFAYDNVKDLSLFGSSEVSIEQMERRHEIDEIYMSNETLPNASVTLEFVEQYFPEIEELDKVGQVERLQKKYELYHNAYYKWQYIWGCLLASMLGWYYPDLLLKIRAWLIKTEADIDTMQLQTVLAILSSMQVDVLDTLEWLKQQSKVFHEILVVAYDDYPSDPMLALAKAIAKSDNYNFRKMMEGLSLAVYELPMSEAFRTLRSDRNQMRLERSAMQVKTLNSKRQWASPVSMMPLVFLLFFHLLVPVCVLGWQDLNNVLSSLG